MNKFAIIAAALILAIITMGHTLIIASGSTTPEYERLRDIAIVILSGALASYSFNGYFSKEGNAHLFLALGALYAGIGMLHLLRLFFGGLPC